MNTTINDHACRIGAHIGAQPLRANEGSRKPMPFYARFAIGLSTLALSIAVASCGPVMEATRPDPVDIKQFVPGEARINVLAEVGAPVATTKESGNSCDIYKLYTRGPGAVGKGVIAAGEAVGDVFTLGLSEVLWTPGEAMTRNSKHTVLFCYDPASKLVSVNESETHVDN